MKFQSTKIYDGFSTCFRQWRAEKTNCKYLHGYDISFKIIFEGELNENNWIFDFGGMKRAKEKIDNLFPNDWFNHMFDHTTIISEDDPFINFFHELYDNGVIQLRIMPHVGIERFAEFVFNKVNEFVKKETNDRVQVISVECKEHYKNSAIYSE